MKVSLLYELNQRDLETSPREPSRTGTSKDREGWRRQRCSTSLDTSTEPLLVGAPGGEPHTHEAPVKFALGNTPEHQKRRASKKERLKDEGEAKGCNKFLFFLYLSEFSSLKTVVIVSSVNYWFFILVFFILVNIQFSLCVIFVLVYSFHCVP